VSRWKYVTANVTVGANSIEVRQLTVKERLSFAEASQKVKAGTLDRLELPKMVLQFGVSGLSGEDFETMPADLVDAAVEKILELSGIGKDEKKEPAPVPV
jgi:hypothetical protein